MAMTKRQTELDEEGRRHGVDMAFARIEDALATLRKYEPLNEAEGSHASELAKLLIEKAGIHWQSQ